MSTIGRAVLTAAAGIIGATTPASVVAQGSGPSLLVNTNPSGMWVYEGLHVGGGVWTGTTSLLQSTFGVALGSTTTLLDRGQLLHYDALWVDQRYQSAPLASEVDNLLAFAATGRHVVVVGENATWGAWTPSILAAFGGAEDVGYDQMWYWTHGAGPGCMSGLANTVVSNALTVGVSTVNMACGGHAAGGTALFDYNVATLWGPKQNVLTILDANIFDDRFIGYGDGAQFRQNVVTWLASPPPRAPLTAVPEPATFVLVGAGLLALGTMARRRNG